MEKHANQDKLPTVVSVERKPALPAVPGAHVMIKNQTAQAAHQIANAAQATVSMELADPQTRTAAIITVIMEKALHAAMIVAAQILVEQIP